jgi:hypothetical protein
MRASRRAAHLVTIKRSDSPPANGYRTMAARRTADIGMREALANQDPTGVSDPHKRP